MIPTGTPVVKITPFNPPSPAFRVNATTVETPSYGSSSQSEGEAATSADAQHVPQTSDAPASGPRGALF